MKIGIITITQGSNYGNRLQIYAVQEVLRRLGHESWLILNNTHAHGFIYNIKKIIKIIISYKNERYDYFRKKSFDKYDHAYIKISDKSFNENYENSDIGSVFDVILCGSDQVWNPFSPFLNGGCFGDFKGVKKRISYAASFGESEIPKDKHDYFAQMLMGMDLISVREKSGVNIVANIANRKADLLIDPTMMLDADDWMKIEECPKNFKKRRYVFQYFLGVIKPEVMKCIKEISEVNNLEIINVLPDVRDDNYKLNPSHFIYLLHHSEIVITDSFHASVFAILFGKPLRVFDRQDAKFDMSSRFDSLTDLFDCGWVMNNFFEEYERHPRYGIMEKLKIERQRAFDFLNKAL